MENENYIEVKSLSWWGDTLIIRGRNTGLSGLVAVYNNDTVPLIKFLNKCLIFEHVKLYEDILCKYEDRLHTENIFDFSIPTIPDNYQKIDRTSYQTGTFPDDASLVDALLQDYESRMKILTAHFAQWEAVYESWYQDYIKNNK